MAQWFGVSSSQANSQYDAVVKALVTLQGQKFEKDALSTNTSSRAAQNGVIRYPWVMSTTEWLLQNPPRGIAWEINPSEITWSMAQRSTTTKTLIGTVLHVWPNAGRNTFFDEARISMNLQSGNLIPVRINGGEFEPSGGIANFYDFMQLVDAPKLTVGDNNQPPRANLVSIQYRSKIFPKLTLLGMFDPVGIKFTDTSTDNQITGWSADFIVYDTIPKMSSFNGQSQNPLLESMFGDLKNKYPLSLSYP